MTKLSKPKTKFPKHDFDSFWTENFDFETIEKSVNALTKKGDLKIRLADFKELIKNYFTDFKKVSKKTRTEALLKLIKIDRDYRSYTRLNYPVWDNQIRFKKGRQPLIFKKFNKEADFIDFFQEFILQSKIRGKKVVVKPNFVSAEEYPETTNKVLLASIVSVLKKNHPGSLKIFEGPSIFYDDSFLKKIKFDGCPIINTLISQNLVKIKVEKRDISFFIEKEILESDFLINLACLKEHRSAVFSASKKNLMGLLPGFERLRFHKNLNLNSAINSLAIALLPTFNIIDARKIQKRAQMKRFGGKPKKGKGIYFSSDCFALDRLAIKENFDE